MNEDPQRNLDLGSIPFFRWAGGKQKLIGVLKEHLPDDLRNRTYHEPFLGAGSMFLSALPPAGFLSDSNPQIVNTFRAVQIDPVGLYRFLSLHKHRHGRHYYRNVRKAFNSASDQESVEQAARFIYLIQSSFNGIFRVNTRGEYNVPFGKENPHFPSLLQLLLVSRNLKHAKLNCADFESSLGHVKRGDFVYMDPPYPPLNGTSFFQHYTKDRFSAEDQERLARVANNLANKGCKVLISNADIPTIRILYRGWHFTKVEASRSISCKPVRTAVSELIIKNY